jgi:hypothetical protein
VIPGFLCNADKKTCLSVYGFNLCYVVVTVKIKASFGAGEAVAVILFGPYGA